MKWFFKYLFPALFGLLIYTSLRLVNDVISDTQFWKRHWSINAIEIGSCIVISYLLAWVLNYFVKKFTIQNAGKITAKTFLKEFATVCFICLLILNMTAIPMAALTDDGLQMYDVVNINLIPTLYLLLYYAIARGNAYIIALNEQRIQMEKIRNDQLNTELKFLKAQYHPHFLFNALNTIYFQMDENIGDAKKSIEKISELLRYQLYDQQQKVSVSQELQYLTNFIQLQKTRSSSQLKLNVQFDKQLNGQQLYPLLLLPLVENAFKYVGGDYKIDIAASDKNGILVFRVENSIPTDLTIPKDSGIGLENLRRRLELLYPHKHRIDASKKNNQYIAELEIDLN